MARVRAPELRGRAWLNTGGKELKIADLRGRITLLDFWTFCCINCLHVLDELRPLEARYSDVLVVIGVHSPKFEHEKDPDAVAAAVERYQVEHPVLDDPELLTWQQYAARAWPTLSVIDPEGYLVASMAGEGHAEGLRRLIDELITEHEAKGTLHRGNGPFVPPSPARTELRFPGKALVLPDGRFGASESGGLPATPWGLLVSDSARHQIAVLSSGDHQVVQRIGTGTRGREDGLPEQAAFAEPQGLCLLPPHAAEICGYDVIVADTANHLLRGLRLNDLTVSTVAGTGRQWRSTLDDHSHDSRSLDLSSPWDVAWFDDRIIIAMAGSHTLWWFDPVKRTAGVYAGTTVEALRDGPLAEAWLAQPSGLATSPDGSRLWLADSESSALRYIVDGQLHTVVGQGLFDFGHVDGPAGHALLQHPLGVCALGDGSVLVADTYNGALRRYRDGQVSTIARDLAEPSDVVVTPEGTVLVVESAAHRVVPIELGEPGGLVDDSSPDGVRHKVERPPTKVAPGDISLNVIFTPPPGQKLDESFGPATRLEVSASPPGLLLGGTGAGVELTRRLTINPAVSSGVLQVVAQAATCDSDAEHAACHLTRQDWGVPVTVTPDAPPRLALVLRGLDTPAS